ncbi:MAG TPA: hypothetical protein VKE98_02245 [Gemmataceae bacterium]|nr:hypothetical protein [Gemmataceae bacterium]
MPLIDGPGHDQHIGPRQRAVTVPAGFWAGFWGQSFGPRDVCESRQAGRRGEGQELSACWRFGIEIDDFPLQILGRADGLRRPSKREGRSGRELGDGVKAEISLHPSSVCNHDVSSWVKKVESPEVPGALSLSLKRSFLEVFRKKMEISGFSLLAER